MVFTSSDTLEIKTLEQLNALYEIASKVVLTKSTFSSPLRLYRLIKPDAKCQYLRGSKSCGQEHQHGYVVETTDEKHVLIGHCCALNHLGLDDEKVKASFSRVRKEYGIAIRQARVNQILQGKDLLIKQVKESLKETVAVLSEANRILRLLPEHISKTLVDRHKRRDMAVKWEYLIVKTEKEDDGRVVSKKYWHPHTFGFLKGSGDWLEPSAMPHRSDLLMLLHELENIPSKESLTKDEMESAESVIKRVSSLDKLRRDLSTQRKLMEDFCRMDNLILLAQLTSNRSLRADTVIAIHEILGASLQQDANKFINSIDRDAREQYGASGLRIAS